jgi:hypothetical protein
MMSAKTTLYIGRTAIKPEAKEIYQPQHRRLSQKNPKKETSKEPQNAHERKSWKPHS